jgi:hypothetical protein
MRTANNRVQATLDSAPAPYVGWKITSIGYGPCSEFRYSHTQDSAPQSAILPRWLTG